MKGYIKFLKENQIVLILFFFLIVCCIILVLHEFFEIDIPSPLLAFSFVGGIMVTSFLLKKTYQFH